MRILSLDPGTNFTGVALLELDKDGVIAVILAETINANTECKHYKDVEYIHGLRYAKIIAIETRLKELLSLFNPQLVISESPYFNPTRPQAFSALVEVLSMFRSAVYRFNPSIVFETIDPSSIKNSLSVKGNSGDKLLMKQALINTGLIYYNNLDVNGFDEHTVDAVAVGYARCIELNNL
jgi:Holliday junction resolvasome RuvABC endonuclease subunit